MDTYYILFGVLSLLFLFVKFVNRKRDNYEDEDNCDI